MESTSETATAITPTKASRNRQHHPWHAVLFDLDGTLVDSYRAIQTSVNHVRALHHLPPLMEAEVRAAVGNGLLQLLSVTVPTGDLQENAKVFSEHHPTILGKRTRVLPQVRRTLATLRRRGSKLAVCSNKPIAMTEQMLRELQLADHFGAVLGPELVPQQKPAPDMVLEAMRRLEVTPENTLYVGDMTIDVQTARAAGVSVWVIPSGSHSKEELTASAPDRVMERFNELLASSPGKGAK